MIFRHFNDLLSLIGRVSHFIAKSLLLIVGKASYFVAIRCFRLFSSFGLMIRDWFRGNAVMSEDERGSQEAQSAEISSVDMAPATPPSRHVTDIAMQRAGESTGAIHDSIPPHIAEIMRGTRARSSGRIEQFLQDRAPVIERRRGLLFREIHRAGYSGRTISRFAQRRTDGAKHIIKTARKLLPPRNTSKDPLYISQRDFIHEFIGSEFFRRILFRACSTFELIRLDSKEFVEMRSRFLPGFRDLYSRFIFEGSDLTSAVARLYRAVRRDAYSLPISDDGRTEIPVLQRFMEFVNTRYVSDARIFGSNTEYIGQLLMEIRNLFERAQMVNDSRKQREVIVGLFKRIEAVYQCNLIKREHWGQEREVEGAKGFGKIIIASILLGDRDIWPANIGFFINPSTSELEFAKVDHGCSMIGEFPDMNEIWQFIINCSNKFFGEFRVDLLEMRSTIAQIAQITPDEITAIIDRRMGLLVSAGVDIKTVTRCFMYRHGKIKDHMKGVILHNQALLGELDITLKFIEHLGIEGRVDGGHTRRGWLQSGAWLDHINEQHPRRWAAEYQIPSLPDGITMQEGVAERFVRRPDIPGHQDRSPAGILHSSRRRRKTFHETEQERHAAVDRRGDAVGLS